MRATISFDIDVEHVEATMATLVSMEADTLRAVADMIDVQPGPRTMVLEEVTEALRLMQETTSQLQQYQQMLMSFEKAKFETMLPMPAPAAMPVPEETTNPSFSDIKTAIEDMQSFDNFLSQVPDEDGLDIPTGEEDDEPKEG